jgi:FKBP-type peptidyl-prolyl cis-trans isomerase
VTEGSRVRDIVPSHSASRSVVSSRLRRLPLCLVLTLAWACGDKEEPAVPIESTTFAPSLAVDLQASTKSPTGLYYRDLIPGTGTTLAPGQTVGMRYVGSFADGRVFDSNPAPKPAFTFKLGSGQVIQGWDEGLVGMKVGGKRQLVIPASLGYGANRVGPIPPNSVLVFTVDALSAQ